MPFLPITPRAISAALFTRARGPVAFARYVRAHGGGYNGQTHLGYLFSGNLPLSRAVQAAGYDVVPIGRDVLGRVTFHAYHPAPGAVVVVGRSPTRAHVRSAAQAA